MALNINKGLNWQRWVDPIESFVREHGHQNPRWAVICTYECEMDRLEQDVLPMLTRRGRAFRTVVFADVRTLQKQLKTRGKVIAGRINVHPVRLLKGGVFHPKLVVLRAGSNVRVCFGSANVTSGGMGRNLELWSYTDDTEITSATMKFIDGLTSHENIALDPPSKRAIHRAFSVFQKNYSPSFWASIDESYIHRLKKKNSGLSGAKSVHIISPAYASTEGVKSALSSFPKSRTTVYTDAVLACKGVKFQYFNPPYAADNPSEKEETIEPRPSTLHAKAYLFEHKNGATLWFGSANLTAPALVRSFRTGGNVEILVRAFLKQKEFKAFLYDLRQYFPDSTVKIDKKKEKEPHTIPQGFVLSGELQNRDGELRLVIHTLPNVRKVKLDIAGKIFHLVIKHSRGIIEDIQRFLPELKDGRNGDDWTALIYEVIGSDRISVIVNVPLDSITEESSTEDVLDSLLDEFLGRWPIKTRRKTKSAPEITDGELPDEPFGDDDEGRLDEVAHQGALDKLAVKAAIIKKRIASMQGNDKYRDSLEDMVAKTLLKTCAPHLHPVIKSWFKKNEQ